MKIWTNLSGFNATNAVITIGSFDGVHLGHKQVLNKLAQTAAKVNGQSVVFTFWPHPATVLQPATNIGFLNTIDEKIELFKLAGVNHLIIYPFSVEFSQLNYNNFVKQILVDKLNVNTLLVGYDNKIGKNREGNFEQVKKLAKIYGFCPISLEQLKIGENLISSTNIRNLLANGKVYDASKLLGYYYSITGKVVKGQQIGNKIGFPTANIEPDKQKIIPANGVYAIIAKYNNSNYKGIMNIGLRPTIGNKTILPVIEAHLFNFNGNLYNQQITVKIIHGLRSEQKFESVDALRAQISADKARAIKLLENIDI